MVSVFGFKGLICDECHQDGAQISVKGGPVLALAFAFVVSFE